MVRKGFWIVCVVLVLVMAAVMGGLLLLGIYLWSLPPASQEVFLSVLAAASVLWMASFVLRAYLDSRRKHQGFWHVFLYDWLKLIPYVSYHDKQTKANRPPP